MPPKKPKTSQSNIGFNFQSNKVSVTVPKVSVGIVAKPADNFNSRSVLSSSKGKQKNRCEQALYSGNNARILGSVEVNRLVSSVSNNPSVEQYISLKTAADKSEHNDEVNEKNVNILNFRPHFESWVHDFSSVHSEQLMSQGVLFYKKISEKSYLHGREPITRSLSTLQKLIALSSPYNRGELKAESQVIGVALRAVNDMDGAMIVELATRKIQQWWRLVHPRYMLLARMGIVNLLKMIINDIINDAAQEGHRRCKHRLNLINKSAAIKIQMLFRRTRARARIRYVWKVTRSALLVYRFIRKFNTRHNHWQQSEITRKTCILGFFTSISEISRNCVNGVEFTSPLSADGGKGAFVESVVNIQNQVLRIVAVNKSERTAWVKSNLQYGLRILGFFMFAHAKISVQKRVAHLKYLIIIQKVVRGFLVRSNFFRRLKASLRISQAWRGHKSYWSLKHELRQLHRPLNLTLHAIRNVNEWVCILEFAHHLF